LTVGAEASIIASCGRGRRRRRRFDHRVVRPGSAARTPRSLIAVHRRLVPAGRLLGQRILGSAASGRRSRDR